MNCICFIYRDKFVFSPTILKFINELFEYFLLVLMTDFQQEFPQADHTFSIIDTPERPYLHWLQTGIKTTEGRVNSPKYQNTSVGDSIIFIDQNQSQYIYGTIIFKHEYHSFQAMLDAEGVSNMLPFLNPSDLQQGIAVYNHFPGSERVHIFGCVALGIKVEKYKLNL